MAASVADLTAQIVSLNSAVHDIQQRFEGANAVIAAQSQRIGQLEQRGTSAGQSFPREPLKRTVDLKSLTPEPFTSKDEGRWREWAEEFTEYIKGISEPLGMLLVASVDSEVPNRDLRAREH